MKNNKIELIIESKDGRALRTYSHEGKYYIESRTDSEYQLRVKNKTGERIKAVLSVDGINIITGKPVTDQPTESGYVLQPYMDEVFKGYRVDEDTVASFKFVAKESSYASTEHGSFQTNGVIALRAFAEKVNETQRLLDDIKKKLDRPNQPPQIIPVPYYPIRPNHVPYVPYEPYWRGPYWYSSCTTAALNTGEKDNITEAANTQGFTSNATLRCNNAVTFTACSLNSETSDNPFVHGSTFGTAIGEKVVQTTFEVGRLLSEVAIYYAPSESLKSLGVPMATQKVVAFPEPFKREWAQPPKNWTR